MPTGGWRTGSSWSTQAAMASPGSLPSCAGWCWRLIDAEVRQFRYLGLDILTA